MSETTPARPAPREITCESCRELLSEYVDRELSEEEKTSVEHHVATCVKCAGESTRLVGLKNIVQNWEGVKGSNKFREAVMEKYISESRMMASKPFTEAAAIARAESQRKQDEIRSPARSWWWWPLILALIGGALLAIALAISSHRAL